MANVIAVEYSRTVEDINSLLTRMFVITYKREFRWEKYAVKW